MSYGGFIQPRMASWNVTLKFTVSSTAQRTFEAKGIRPERYSLLQADTAWFISVHVQRIKWFTVQDGQGKSDHNLIAVAFTARGVVL